MYRVCSIRKVLVTNMVDAFCELIASLNFHWLACFFLGFSSPLFLPWKPNKTKGKHRKTIESTQPQTEENQRKSKETKGNQRKPKETKGNQRKSKETKVNRRKPRGNQRKTIEANQPQTKENQRKSKETKGKL